MRSPSSDSGFSLVETMIALGVLTVGVLGAAAVLTTGMRTLGSSPGDVVVMQKATEAIEAVFSARDSHRLTWAQLQNVFGASGSDGGIFTDGAQPMTLAGPDGLVDTIDDPATIESVILPGQDQKLGTADDITVVLTQYTRTITIRNVLNDPVGCSAGPSAAPCQLRSVTVTITYTNGTRTNSYTLTTFISAYS
jgi:prepilin-type N-terminal cleavage/methylation domain-containing protein